MQKKTYGIFPNQSFWLLITCFDPSAYALVEFKMLKIWVHSSFGTRSEMIKYYPWDSPSTSNNPQDKWRTIPWIDPCETSYFSLLDYTKFPIDGEFVNYSHRKKHMVEIIAYKINMLTQVQINIIWECCKVLPSIFSTKSRQPRDWIRRYA